jgi:lysophospholipase L1-like esterase
MASAGDSITRAFDIDWSHFLSDSPQYSWSTGSDGAVRSEYQRILTAKPAIRGNAYNDAQTGAKMVDLAGQLTAAASQKVQYLTILMGANDLCTSSAATMTPTATFQAQFEKALSTFLVSDPTARVMVVSIPNIYQLWNTLHGNWAAEATWNSVGICQSMLSWSNSEADRQQVVAQEAADNAVLASVCAKYSTCRWDGYAAYHVQFSAGDVSTVDYFHPNKNGQNTLAATAWASGYWPATP